MSDQPIAWLIRESGFRSGRDTRIMAGKIFLSEETAQAAADRLTNAWRRCWIVPVVEADEPYRGMDSD